MRKTIQDALPAIALLALLAPAGALGQQGQPQQQERDAEVQVQAPRPEVQVQQAAPEVQVQQPAPDVRIRQGQPEIQLDPARPQVNVQPGQQPEIMVQEPPARTEAQVTRPGETQVQVQMGEPDVRIETAEPNVQVEQAEQQPKIEIVRMSRREAEMQDAGIARGDLIGMEVVGSEGDGIGEVDDIIMAQGQRLDRLVIQMGGGLFGGEERLVAVPWNEVRFDPEQRRLQVQLSEEEAERRQPFQYSGQEARLSQSPEGQRKSDQPRQADATQERQQDRAEQRQQQQQQQQQQQRQQPGQPRQQPQAD